MADRLPAVPPLVLANRCTGCGTCISACAPHAIHMHHLEDGRKLAHVTASACRLTGDCIAACPHDAFLVKSWLDGQQC